MRQTQDLMGMPVTVHLAGPNSPPKAISAVFSDFAFLDALFSPFKTTSAISRLNAGTLLLPDAPIEVLHVLDLCTFYAHATEGYFSSHPTSKLDPNGLVKGFALDRACAILGSFGCQDYLIDAGGDTYARGQSAPSAPWRVGIRHPIERDRVACVVLASNLAIATSGTYEKGLHILDPHTGLPATTWLSFTVTGPDILQADVYATAACAMQEKGPAFIARQEGYEAYAIAPDLSATFTPGFRALCDPAVSI